MRAIGHQRALGDPERSGSATRAGTRCCISTSGTISSCPPKASTRSLLYCTSSFPSGALARPTVGENWTIPEYLAAMAAWLELYEQAYINTERPVPADGWTIFAQALQAAAVYE